MKRTVLINLICSFITVLVLALGIIFAITVNDPTILSKPKLVISSESSTAVYDGKPLTNSKWHLVSGELKDGHKLTVEVSGVQTDVGISENYVFAKITDSKGEDVSSKYKIEYLPGALNVKPRSITVSAKSDEKEYDGTPLTCNDYELKSSMELLPDHTIVVTVEGSVLSGNEKNKIADVKIINSAGVDVTKNYSIKTTDGTLTVNGGPDSGSDDNGENSDGGDGGNSDGGDGGDGGGDIVITPPPEDEFTIGLPDIIGGGGGGDGELTPVFVVNSNTDGPIYLKQTSYGDYTGRSFLKAPEWNTLWNGNLSAYYIASRAAYGQGAPVSTVTIDSKFGLYALPYYSLASVSDVQKGDVSVSGDASSPYQIQYVCSPNSFDLPSDMKEYEQMYKEFVHSNYLSIDAYTKAYFSNIISDNGFDPSDPNVINMVAKYIQNAATYSMKYDRALDQSNNIAVEFLRTYKSGICQHYALAATMLYRALGIPARFTVGYAGNTVAGEDVEITVMDAHAWVEVYVNGQGWIMVEVTGGGPGGGQSGSGSNSGGGSGDNPGGGSGNNPGGGSGDNPGGGSGDNPGGGSGNNPGGGSGGGNTPPDDYTLGLPSGSDGADGRNEVMLVIKSERGGKIYLRIASYGDFNGQTFLAAPKYSYFVENNRSAYYLPAYALDNGGLNTYSLTIDSKSGEYVLPYYTASGNDVQSSDTVFSGDTSSPYTVEYYAWAGTSGIVVPSKYNGYEDDYGKFVRANYLNIDDETKAFLDSVISANGFTAMDKNIISRVASYISNAAEYDLDYDRGLDSSENIVKAFLSEYKKGICQHYAAAATMLYRALGIPARFTYGYVADVKAGEEYEVTGKMAHAWVEVYVDNIGWINVEVTGSDRSSEVFNLTLAPEDVRVPYDGSNDLLMAENILVGFNIAKNGYTYKASVDGSVIGLGRDESEITELLIYDPSGELVYQKTTGLGADRFKITYKTGVVHHYLSTVKFESGGREKTYDGIPLETLASDCYLKSGEVYAHLGYTYVITPTGSISNAGSAAATFTVKFYKDGVDCTDHFWLGYIYGKLTVNAREITISAESASKAFDGTALTCNDITYDASLLASTDHVESYVVEGSQKNIGKSSNVLKSVTIVNEDGEDVTGNYKITIRDGILTVTGPTT